MLINNTKVQEINVLTLTLAKSENYLKDVVETDLIVHTTKYYSINHGFGSLYWFSGYEINVGYYSLIASPSQVLAMMEFLNILLNYLLVYKTFYLIYFNNITNYQIGAMTK